MSPEAPGSTACHNGDVVTTAHSVRYTYAQYLTLERTSNVKHEFLGGQIFAMAGGTPEHAALAAAFVGLLFPSLTKHGCRAHSSDLRVRVRETGLATYPDVAIVCGPSERDPEDADAVTNPVLIVEVLSPSTEEYDRGEKLQHYQRIPSLTQYVLVAQDTRRIESWSREGDTWTRTALTEADTLELPAVAATLAVRTLYDTAAEPA